MKHKITIIVMTAMITWGCRTVKREYMEVIPYSTALPSSLTIENIDLSPQWLNPDLKDQTAELARDLVQKYPLPEKGNPGCLYLWVSQKSLSSDLTPQNSITVRMTVRDRQSGQLLYQVLHTEVGSESLDSYLHLYNILDESISLLSKTLAARSLAESES